MAEIKEKAKQDFKHIVRIGNVDIPGEKPLRVALTKIKGIGINFADVLCHISKINKKEKAGNLSEDNITKLNDIIKNPVDAGIPVWLFNRKRDFETGEDKHLLTGTLHFAQDNDLKRLKKNKTLRGMRHQKGLPVRGQRTRANFRKSKGKVVGVKKKSQAAKK